MNFPKCGFALKVHFYFLAVARGACIWSCLQLFCFYNKNLVFLSNFPGLLGLRSPMKLPQYPCTALGGFRLCLILLPFLV